MLNSLHIDHAAAQAEYRLSATRVARRPRRAPGAPTRAGALLARLVARLRRTAEVAALEIADAAPATETGREAV